MNLITHRSDSYDIDTELKKLRERFLNDTDKLKLFDQLCEFDYGRWLLVNQGLNSYWSNYMLNHNEINKKLHPLEYVLLEKSPGVVASKERAKLNQNIIQNLIDHDNMNVCSVPCGFMNDLLRLDLNGRENIKLVGVDLDPKAIEGAKENSKKLNKDNISEFYIRDAWKFNFENEFDIIHNSGLNMYVKTEADLLELYSNLFKALKPGGYLIVTSNTPPMDDNGKQYWNISESEYADLPMQGLIFAEIIQVRQGLYCTEKQIINQLKTVGFNDVKVDYDSRKMFLSFIARK